MTKFKIAIQTHSQILWLKENYPDHYYLGMIMHDTGEYNGWAHLECTQVDAALIAIELSTKVKEYA